MNRLPTQRTAPRLTPREIAGRYAELLRATRGWLLIVTIIFVASIVGGVLGASASPERHAQLLQEATERLRPALEALRSGDNTRAIGMIFWNNLRISLLIMGAGAVVFPLVLGVPMLFIGANGYLLGAIAALSRQGIDRLLLAILPHGIFELPAVIIAGAWSLKMGVNWLLPAATGRRGDVWRETVFEGLWIVPLVTVLLAIAAVVEVLVTGQVVRALGGS
jgi:stage II sporulation protein M